MPPRRVAPDEVIGGFESLRAAVIDASSVIYCRKAGFFGTLSQVVGLFSIPGVLHELGSDTECIAEAECRLAPATIDHQLVACAAQMRLPVLSEDRKVLRAAGRLGLPCYNALMLLNFLLWKKTITPRRYDYHAGRLRGFAWYAPEIWEFAQAVKGAMAGAR